MNNTSAAAIPAVKDNSTSKAHFTSKLQSVLLGGAVWVAAGITLLSLLSIIIYILYKGIPNLSLELFAPQYTTENLSLFPALINTVTMTLLSLVIAVPLGVFSAVYMVEYAKRGNKLVTAVGITTETLSGIPSIVYGLFGYLLFVSQLKWGYCMMAGALTLSIMILPLIMRTTEEALRSVPDSFREGSFGLGAGKLRTVFRIVLPSAVPGILAGVILAIGRIAGETAALIFTAGTVAQIPDSFMGSGRTLAIHLYALWNEGLAAEQSYATAVVLLVIVVLINMLSSFIAKKISK
ncbi:MAG: phosphate ABC transporter permease PstA [Oscillospiraceae bacterium]|nr:phosphate ABC transporter permease PstA [Oscillospiraceae bacterium]